MKIHNAVLAAIVVAMLAGLTIYSQVDLPAGAAAKAVSGGYGAGGESDRRLLINWEVTDANPQLLVTPFEIDRGQGKWVIVDLRDRASYEKGHIPGAIHLGDRAHKLLRGDAVIAGRTLPYLALRPVAELEAVFSRAGITHDQTLVLYSDAEDILPGYAFVPFLVLEYLGHRDVRVLDGGFESWLTHRRPVETRVNTLPPSDFKARLNPHIVAGEAEVLGIAQGRIKNVQLVDSRVPVEFTGEHKAPPGHFLYDAVARTGRIPNVALNVPHFQQFVDMETLKLKLLPDLAMLYGGLDRKKRTILYCYIANRISFSYFVARLIGFDDPAIYHDSWIVWGNNPDLPVERDPRFNQPAAAPGYGT